MSNYRDLKRAVAAQSVAGVAMVRATAPDAATFAVAAGLVVAAANARAVALSDLALAEWLHEDPLGLIPAVDDATRLEGAFATIFDTTSATEDPTMRLDRLATAEPLGAAQGAWGDGLRGHQVDGWTRLAADDACAVCQDLADGSVHDADFDMTIPHPTCTCIAEPVGPGD